MKGAIYMTVKELYDWCKNRNIENCELLIEYACNDDYYSFSETIKESNLRYGTESIFETLDEAKIIVSL